jgi:hypothetical protein
MVVPQCGPHQKVEMSVSPVWATLGDPQCGNPGVAQIGIFRETPNVGPQCGPPNATLGETRPQCICNWTEGVSLGESGILSLALNQCAVPGQISGVLSPICICHRDSETLQNFATPVGYGGLVVHHRLPTADGYLAPKVCGCSSTD